MSRARVDIGPWAGMRIIALLLLLIAPATAKTLNVEFKFTPFTGDTKEDHVQVVPGKARVFVNNVPIATQDVEAHEVPVMFDEREIAPAVWVTAESLGPIVRKGKMSQATLFSPHDHSASEHNRRLWWTDSSIGARVTYC